MQILESSALGLRAARMVFRSHENPVVVTLYPMVHLGDERFYDDVYDEAFSNDVVLEEGVHSPIAQNLTRSYRWVNVQRLGLVRQPKSITRTSITARVVNADLTAEEFEFEWRKIPLRLRAIFAFAAPLYGVYQRLFASRRSLARKMSLEDLQSEKEVLEWDPSFELVHHSLIHSRDQRLVERLAAELEGASEKRVAIVYGAMHMRAVVRELTRRGFKCRDATWHTAFTI
jgi:hypothetical protein